MLLRYKALLAVFLSLIARSISKWSLNSHPVCLVCVQELLSFLLIAHPLAPSQALVWSGIGSPTSSCISLSPRCWSWLSWAAGQDPRMPHFPALRWRIWPEILAMVSHSLNCTPSVFSFQTQGFPIIWNTVIWTRGHPRGQLPWSQARPVLSYACPPDRPLVEVTSQQGWQVGPRWLGLAQPGRLSPETAPLSADNLSTKCLATSIFSCCWCHFDLGQ